MERFDRLTGPAAPLDTPNVETDLIFPSRFLKKPLSAAYAGYLFHDLRFDAEGAPVADCVLNREPGPRILVANRNFGCGSAREGAVYALSEFGVRSIIAPSFGDIFFTNCLTNGLLPVRLDGADCARLRAQVAERPGAEMTVDLEGQRVVGPDGGAYPFDIDPFWKRCLIAGLDQVEATLEHEAEIAAFEERYRSETSWLFDTPLS